MEENCEKVKYIFCFLGFISILERNERKMTEESIGMKEMMKSLQNIAKDVLKIEEKIHRLNEESHKAELQACLQETNEDLLEKQDIQINKANLKEKEEQQEKVQNTYKIEQIEKKEQVEKPKLVISERTGCVYLPYTQSDIEYYKRCGYSTTEEIVRMFYTVPLKRYSNFSKSRVKERICSNERERKGRSYRINKICKEFKKRKKVTSSNNNSMPNCR